jgi:hypothetical protein
VGDKKHEVAKSQADQDTGYRNEQFDPAEAGPELEL